MRRAYVGLSIGLALFIIAQGVNRPVFFYALIIPGILFIYGLMAKEILPEVIAEEDEKNPGEDAE
jgi:hypothetical protein